MEGSAVESAIILDVQRNSQHDGPGIRTTVFLKGCSLRCKWCHNPESQEFMPQLMYQAERCHACGKCVPACPNGAQNLTEGTHNVAFGSCNACGACTVVCPANALTVQGKSMTVERVFDIVKRDRVFYEHTGGGVTLSGGEPLLQPGFCHKLLKICSEEGIHTCIETCGQVSQKAIEQAAPFTDLFLFDYKITGEKKAQTWIGADGVQIRSNLEYILSMGKSLILRCPLIPGVNDDTEHFNAIRDIVKGNPSILCAELLPYHNFGEIKGKNIGISEVYKFHVPKESEKERWMDYLRQALGERVRWG